MNRWKISAFRPLGGRGAEVGACDEVGTTRGSYSKPLPKGIPPGPVVSSVGNQNRLLLFALS